MKLGNCKGCGCYAKLLKSHIFPRSFSRKVIEADGYANVYSAERGAYPKRSRTGIYEYFLCAQCEGLFQLWDDYAAKLLLATIPAIRADLVDQCRIDALDILGIKHGEGIGWKTAPEFDYHKLKMFFISILWRAALASHEFFGGVSLGAHESTLRRMVYENDPLGPLSYPIFLFVFDDDEPSRVWTNPVRRQSWNVNGYWFLLGGFSVFIKTDSRPVPASVQRYAISPESPLTLIVKRWEISSERRILLNGVSRIADNPVNG